MAHIHEKIDFTVGALIVHDGRVLLVHHKKLDYWVVPGGHIELDEDPDQALFREIEEETGLRKEDLEILSERSEFSFKSDARLLYRPQWMSFHPFGSGHHHVVFEHIVRSKSDRIMLAPEEHHDIRWFTVGELDDEARNIPNEIRWYAKEAIHIAA